MPTGSLRSRRRHGVFLGAGQRRSEIDADMSPVWEEASSAAAEGSLGANFYSRDALFRRSLAAVDVLAAYGALLIASLLIGHHTALSPAVIVIAPFVVFASKVIGLYDRDQNTLRKTTMDELPSILNLSFFYALLVWLVEGLLLEGRLERAQVFTLAVACLALITLGRSLARYALLAIMPAERCIFLGNSADAARIINKLSESPGVKAHVVARVALSPPDENRGSGGHSLADVQAVIRVIAEQNVERVIIAPDGHDEEDMLHAIRLLKALGVKVSVLPRLLEVVGSSSTFDEIDGITLLGVRQYGLTYSSKFIKRSMDIVVAGISLVLIAPLLLVIALMVKLDSSGPVFFRQPRIGRQGQRFEMLKFRSMVSDADLIKDELRGENEAEGGLFKITNDPRITRVGRLLRPISLDELPQLLNVLIGHMSLVGPRPLVPDEDALIEGWERRRLAVQPGMTGLWQIFGSSRIPMREMVKIDYFYGANWSMWLDLKILIRTIPYVIRRRGL